MAKSRVNKQEGMPLLLIDASICSSRLLLARMRHGNLLFVCFLFLDQAREQDIILQMNMPENIRLNFL